MSYFTHDELKCPHCGANLMNDDFMERVNALRHHLGFPFKVTSAYRCKENELQKGRNGQSVHTMGRAIDISVSHAQAYTLLRHAADYGFTGIGVNQKGNSRFIHLDDFEGNDTQPRPHVWSY